MKLDEIVEWYQKKIGTYDKEPWEKTVEQKILDGFNSVTLKTAKLKTELIDVDLVRGSTFPKAKPKQTLFTVVRLAILRYLLLPIYAQWWVKQTSPNTFALLLILYITQMVSLALYNFNSIKSEDDKSMKLASTKCQAYNTTSCQEPEVESPTNEEQSIVSLWDLLIPIFLSLLLSLIHSQIVATNTINSAKNKRRRFSNAGQCNKSTRELNRIRRRRKLVKFRNEQYDSSTLPRKACMPAMRLSPSGLEAIPVTQTCSTNDLISFNKDEELRAAKSSSLKSSSVTISDSNDSKLSRNNSETNMLQNSNSALTLDLLNCGSSPKKRNVNWQNPLQETRQCLPVKTLQDQHQQTSPQTASSSSSDSTLLEVQTANQKHLKALSPLAGEPVQIAENLLISNRPATGSIPLALNVSNSLPNLRQRRPYNRRGGAAGEDDGFESLNGKSSSGEDTMNQRNFLNFPFNANENSAQQQGSNQAQQQYQQAKTQTHSSTTDETDAEDDDIDVASSPLTTSQEGNYNDCTISATEWLGITTNSEECSYSSDVEEFDGKKNQQNSDDDMDFTPTTILYPHNITERISCTLWDHQDVKKAQMSVLEISSCIIERVESMPETNDYIYFGLLFSFLLSLIPCLCRLCQVTINSENSNEVNYLDLPMLLWEKASFSFFRIFQFAFGSSAWERTVLIISFFQRLCLTTILFIIFAVAERTFKQRFLYAKLFSHLTSSRRARKSNVPHFRLNKVRNIKTWLSVRSYLKKRGPQRSVEVIVSAAFLVTLLLLSFLSVEWLKDSVYLHSHLNLEALAWSVTIGIFLLRFMTLGSKIQKKYRSVSVLITEQINLYLQIEQKPKKKDELMVSNSVLKLAADLLKELESPFKISGLSANPYVFTTIKVVILSALSGVLSEILGFKLKLHKIKIK